MRSTRINPSLSIVLVALVFVSTSHGATVWTGPTISFTKANGANPTLAANQDRITSNVWITRESSKGLFNAKSESFFSHFASPTGTEWANGNISSYAVLGYTDWNTWAKITNGGPLNTVGVNAVVHLLADDIYLSIKFTSWTGGGAGGGFSYERSTAAPVPEPAVLTLGGLSLGLTAMRRKRC